MSMKQNLFSRMAASKQIALSASVFIMLLSSNMLYITKNATAQDLTEQKPFRGAVSIVTKSINADQMPFPGQPLTIKAELKNTRDFRAPLRVLLVRDGVFQELQTKPGLLDANDKPQYELTIPAPLSEVIYQLILTTEDGKIITSDRVSLRRSCTPDISSVADTIKEGVEGDERLKLLISENKRLENEILNLENANKEFDAVKELL